MEKLQLTLVIYLDQTSKLSFMSNKKCINLTFVDWEKTLHILNKSAEQIEQMAFIFIAILVCYP